MPSAVRSCAVALAVVACACTEPSPPEGVARSQVSIARRPSRGGVPKPVIGALQAAGAKCKASLPRLAGQGLYTLQLEVSVDAAHRLQASIASGRLAVFDRCLVAEVQKAQTKMDGAFQPIIVPLGFSL